jgi:hypothetical protein
MPLPFLLLAAGACKAGAAVGAAKAASAAVSAKSGAAAGASSAKGGGADRLFHAADAIHELAGDDDNKRRR